MELLDYEREHLQILRGSLAECTVLLKSDGSFPIAEAGELALYGSGARQTDDQGRYRFGRGEFPLLCHRGGRVGAGGLPPDNKSLA